MFKLSKDILFLIFEELQDDSKSLFSCLMVNRFWCETAVPVLWRDPWSYSEESIQSSSVLVKSTLFDYLSFCRSIKVNTINSIIFIGSTLAYNQFIIQQEFYYFFMKKCPELKYLNMKSIKHQIFYFPEAKNCLESLCKLECDSSIDSAYFYGLSHFCQRIQKLVIINMDTKLNNGIVKLIEVQKNLKHFEWRDDFYDEFFTNDDDPYEQILLALEKKAESLNYLRLLFQYVENYEHILLLEILPKFYKLKILIIDDYLLLNEEQLEKFKMQVYPELEILNIEYNKLNTVSNIIENSGGHLKKILLKPYNIIDFELDNENSLNFIRKVYENCPSLEYLSILISSTKENFTELETLLKRCKNLKSLLIVIFDNYEDTYEDSLKYGKELLKILIRSAPTNFKEIRFGSEFKFSLEMLEEFLENWRGRRALSLFTIDPIYMREDYTELINKYKSNGVVKDFEYGSINYRI
ncbi:hypothetical protein RirG_177660 [Rhizophagus irregularis DAOM 197198w]|uniref:F-box domain-containing protein n=1 Tax=Rhizophagus irregularis (strain DAOM 197198w) TaxID=1432141 RepID=A0A015K034_RHIIW|nr:hypothetical protein RirG_177660 [Rhizophagus irregularis DAOM 197198w]